MVCYLVPDHAPVIVAAKRTPIGRRGGVFSEIHPHELLAQAQQAAIGAEECPHSAIDVLITGCVTQLGEQSYNVRRLAALAAGYPVEVPGFTVNAQCGSSQQAVNIAAAMIGSGAADVILASGVESMSRVSLGFHRQNGPGDPLSKGFRERYEDLAVGESVERMADAWGIGRLDWIAGLTDRNHWRPKQETRVNSRTRSYPSPSGTSRSSKMKGFGIHR